MKPTIAITMTTLGCILAAGLASAQSPTIIQSTRNTMNGVSANTTAASNAALGIQSSAPVAQNTAPAPVGIKSTTGAKKPKLGGPKHGPRFAARHDAPPPMGLAPKKNLPV